MTEAALRTQLQSGKTLAQVAKDRNKSVDGLVTALVAEKKARIEQAVKDGHLTRAQADELVAGIKEHVTAMVNGSFERRREHHFGPSAPAAHRARLLLLFLLATGTACTAPV